jgi:predicted RNA-binding Zn ribbon-like protein
MNNGQKIGTRDQCEAVPEGGETDFEDRLICRQQLPCRISSGGKRHKSKTHRRRKSHRR